MNNEQCLELIELYKNHRSLWDSRDKMYHNKNRREDSWLEISQIINLSVADAKKKMTNLLGSYRRERSRHKQSLSAGSNREDVYISKWFAFDSFAFLSEKNQPNETTDTIDNTDLNNDHQMGNPKAEPETPETSSEAPPASTSEGPPAGSSRASSSICRTKRKRQTFDVGDSVLKKAITLLCKSSGSVTSDPYISFGQHIANELRKYDPQTLSYVKYAINNIIFEADMGKYQAPTHGDSSQYQYSSGQQSAASSEPPHSVQIPTPSPQAMASAEEQDSDAS